MLQEYQGWTVKLEVHNYRDTIKSSNVIGYITGSVEPDRSVHAMQVSIFKLANKFTLILNRYKWRKAYFLQLNHLTH